MICLWETLNFKNCYRLMSHFFPEYGRFVFSTENLIKSLFCGHFGQPRVKCQSQGYLLILSNLSQKSLTFRKKNWHFLWFDWKIMYSLSSSISKVFKTVISAVFIPSGSKSICFNAMKLKKILNILNFDIWFQVALKDHKIYFLCNFLLKTQISHIQEKNETSINNNS